jgi:hypothetical protein
MSIGISKKDPWGTEYGYCVWDHGSTGVCDDETGAADNPAERLEGSLVGTIYPVVALISAGPDKVFTTTCRDFSVADVNGDGTLEDAGDLPLVSKAAETDDDIIFTYTYEEATGASGGLWSIKSGDPGTAVIGKNIETTGVASLQGGILLPDKSLLTCDPTTAGVMARNASTNGIEICDGTDWTAITASGASGGVGLSLDNGSSTPNVSSGMDVDGSCGDATCYSSQVLFTLKNNLSTTSDVLATNLSNTANFEFVSNNCNGNAIAAGASCQMVVRAKASGNISYAATLQVVGNNSPLATLDGTAFNFPGCNAGGNAPGGYYVACGVSGYDLIVTPSGCTGGMTNPTCAGGPDTLTMAVSTSNLGYVLNGCCAGNGDQNTANMIGYTGGIYQFTAASWCNGLTYQGFDDWFLPSRQEVANYLYPNKASVGGRSSGHYWTSSQENLSSANHFYYVDMLDAYTAGGDGISQKYVRCMRWSPSKAVSPTPDTTPASFSFDPKTVITAGQTLTSNAITIYGVTQPINIAISGGTAAKYSINGGAYTSADGTATNGDTITLQANSPAAGLEQLITLNAGSSNATWKVRTAGNNTIRIFTTNSTYSGALGSVGAADATCKSVANAAGLPGTWVAVISASGGEEIINRLPWNWRQLKNMNGQVVATDISDFVDGSVLAPMNYTEAGSTPASSLIWTGLDSSGRGYSSSTRNCYTWSSSSSAYFAYGGDSASTSSGTYFNAVTTSCNNGLRLLCMETNDAGADTDPDAVYFQPQVVFSSGGTGTSNTVTVTGVTDEVSVDIAPSAGSANIIKGGVSVGGTSTMAGLNETLVFTMTAPTVMGTKNTATITIGPDTYTWWVGYADAAKEARIFVTNGTQNGNYGGLVGADAYCKNQAALGAGLSSEWTALLSDTSMNAIDRAPWNWGILRNMHGDIVVDGGFQDLWDGTLDSPIGYDQYGNPNTNITRTTTAINGIKVSNLDACQNWTHGGDTWSTTHGRPNMNDNKWINLGGTSCYYNYSIYCLENIDNSTDTTPNKLIIPYAIQVMTSTTIDSAPVLLGGMSSGVSQSLSVTATGGSPNFDVLRGGVSIATGVTSYSVQNGDQLTFHMTSPATGNSYNKMTITAGGMTSYWRVWTGDPTGTVVKRAFVTTPLSQSTNRGGVATFDADCNSRASSAALGGTWKAIMSGQGDDESQWAVNRIGYNWTTLRRIDGLDIVLAGNIWSTSVSNLLNPISIRETGTTISTSYVKTGTTAQGVAYTTDSSGQCTGWTSVNGSSYNGSSGMTSANWVANGEYGNSGSHPSCSNYAVNYIYCIEQ